MNRHEFENYIRSIGEQDNQWIQFRNRYEQECRPIILYGAGQGLQWYLKFFHKLDYHVEAIIDGSNRYIGQERRGCKRGIVSVDYLDQVEEAYIIISAPAHEKEIRLLLEEKQRDQSEIFCFDVSIGVLWDFQISNFINFLHTKTIDYGELFEKLADDKSRTALKNVVCNWATWRADIMRETAEPNIYFPQFIKDRMEQEIFVDCGAYDGDSIQAFLESTKKFSKIFAFEPSALNYKRLLDRDFMNKFDGQIVVYPYALSDVREQCCFEDLDEQENEGAHIVDNPGKGCQTVTAVRLDDVIKERITYLKMDIEGAEYKALIGAENLIKTYKPKLAISVYHRCDDLINIYELIKTMRNDYSFYLRNNWVCGGTDVVLYAV